MPEDPGAIDKNLRYPDDLARRVLAAGRPLSVLAGISGNRLLQEGQIPMFGPSGLSRFGRDALDQPGVTDVIVLEGINDIGQTQGITAEQLIAGYEQLIRQAHDAGVAIQLGTLTPSGGNAQGNYGSVQANDIRNAVNTWIRTQTLSDGFVDFDAAVRDPSNPSMIDPAYDGGDHLHFNPAGYQALANAIDLALLRGATCAATAPVPAPASGVPPSSSSERPSRWRALARHLVLSFSPRAAPEHRRVVIRMTVRAAGHVVAAATIRLAGRVTKTDRRGHASMRLRFQNAGTVRITARKRGYRTATATLRVRSVPRFAG